jgi:hypothetical protein
MAQLLTIHVHHRVFSAVGRKRGMHSIFYAPCLVLSSAIETRQSFHSFRPHHICPAHVGLQLIRRSFIGGVSLGSIMADACGAGKGKVVGDRSKAGIRNNESHRSHEWGECFCWNSWHSCHSWLKGGSRLPVFSSSLCPQCSLWQKTLFAYFAVQRRYLVARIAFFFVVFVLFVVKKPGFLLPQE